MALWEYEWELPDGRREKRILAAGNRDAARKRAHRNADAFGARLLGDVVAVDASRGSM